MRVVLAILFLAAAIWRTGIDWSETIAHGYAFRFGTFGSVISGRWPRDYFNLVDSLDHSGVPFAWNPVGALIMSLPLALVLASIAAGVWLTRERSRTR